MTELERQWGALLPKTARLDNVTVTYTIEMSPQVQKRFEHFLAMLHYNGGHSSTFGMSFDGDGADVFRVTPKPPRETYLGEVSRIGGDFEIAREKGYSVYFQDRLHLYDVDSEGVTRSQRQSLDEEYTEEKVKG
jgi:hypothetical protein